VQSSSQIITTNKPATSKEKGEKGKGMLLDIAPLTGAQ